MRRGLLLLVAGGVSMTLNAAAGAVPATVAERGAGDDGFALLERAAKAARSLSYHGTQMVSFWSDNGSTSALIDVTHVGGEGLLLRVAPTPQSPGGAVYDDEDGNVPEVVGFATGTLALLAHHYDAGIQGSGVVAGRTADVVTVYRTGSSPTARFWIDRATALPLRREVLDGAGRTVRESAFIDLSVGEAHVARTALDNAGTMPVAAGLAVTPDDVARMRGEGWHVPERFGDLEPFEARLLGEGDARSLQVSYSDGVSSVSVFQQKGRLDPAAVEGWERMRVAGEDVWLQGAFPRRVVWSGDGTVFTVVADCPKVTLDALVGELPHGDPGPGLGARLGHGLARVGSWLNPFA
jgi:negative regulator of sigma E activity